MERGPVPRRFTAAAVDNQVIGALGYFRVEVVVEHPPRRFLRPSLALGAVLPMDVEALIRSGGRVVPGGRPAPGPVA